MSTMPPPGRTDMNTTDKTDELLFLVAHWAERLSNCKAATAIPMPAHLHVDLTLMEMCAVLRNNGREVPLGEDD